MSDSPSRLLAAALFDASLFTDRFAIPVPPGHRFPVGKYRRLRERLLDEHVLHAAELFEPEPVCADELSRAHADDYVSRMLAGYMTDREMRRIGFPWSEALVERSCRSCGGRWRRLVRL